MVCAKNWIAKICGKEPTINQRSAVRIRQIDTINRHEKRLKKMCAMANIIISAMTPTAHKKPISVVE